MQKLDLAEFPAKVLAQVGDLPEGLEEKLKEVAAGLNRIGLKRSRSASRVMLPQDFSRLGLRRFGPGGHRAILAGSRLDLARPRS